MKVKRTHDRMIWFTADTHFRHANIIEYCNRPFENVHEMDETIIERWNERVRPGDIVYHLGDFMFTKKVEEVDRYLSRLSGDVHLLRGNHDKIACKSTKFVDVKSVKGIEFDGQYIVLSHYAMRTWDRRYRGAWQLYGHSHGTLPDLENERATDVGVDRWCFYPVSYDELKTRLSGRTPRLVDHHGRREQQEEEVAD